MEGSFHANHIVTQLSEIITRAALIGVTYHVLLAIHAWIRPNNVSIFVTTQLP